MAEWLGSNIADRYAVIEAMGHKKIYDPADHVVPEEDKPEVQAVEEASAKPAEEEKKEEPSKDSNQSKPELATFALKRGKASGGAPSGQRKSKKAFSDSKKKKPFKKKAKPQQRERVYVAEAKTNPEDSPFAALAQLKVGSKDD